jgi:hypothetical protein
MIDNLKGGDTHEGAECGVVLENKLKTTIENEVIA